METFGYNKAWKVHMFMGCGYPVIGLASIMAYGVIFVLPGDARLAWWSPFLVIALIAWTFFEVRRFRKALGYGVQLSEESVRVGGEEARWEDVSKLEYKNGLGDDPAILVHTKNGQTLGIAGATVGLPYIKGFVEGHAKNAQRS